MIRRGAIMRPYQSGAIPDILAVKCPRCESQAIFIFATFGEIKTKEHISYFKKSRQLDYRRLQDCYGGHRNFAVYYPNLRGFIKNLPADYSSTYWNHPLNLIRQHNSTNGTIYCLKCRLRRKHRLKWPDEAFYQINYKGKNLWAFDRETSVLLLEFVKAKDRDYSKSKFCRFLFKIPAHFLHRKARSTVVKKLHDLLDRT